MRPFLGTTLVSALLLVPPGRVPGPEPLRYAPLMLDCARYRVEVDSKITIVAGRQLTRETSRRDGIMVLRATAADSLIKLEAWFDSLSLWREGEGGRLGPDTDGLIGGRYRGLLTSLGGFTATDTPFIPDEVREVAELEGALGDLLPQLPAVPLRLGAGWKDDFGTVISRAEDGRENGQRVERYRLIRRGSREEKRLLPDSTEVSATKNENESGIFSWSPELGLVRWEREVHDEVRVPKGGLVKQPFTTGIVQQVRVTRVGGGCGE
ncbi:MAG: hypothetical protein U0133_11110 [Gemmatimonadales bacterium]